MAQSNEDAFKELRERYDRLIASLPEGTAVTDHIGFIGRMSKYAANHHFVELKTDWARNLVKDPDDREGEWALISLVDGGPYHFGGYVEKVRLNPKEWSAKWSNDEDLRCVVVYID